MKTGTILLDHGSGGKMSQHLITDLILPIFGNPMLAALTEGDTFDITGTRVGFSSDTHVVAPLGASPEDLRRIPQAEANICLYPEVADSSCRWLERQFGMPTVSTVPIGIGATEMFCRELQELLGLEPTSQGRGQSRMPWYSRPVDSTYLTGKRVFIFADATHAIAAARLASRALGFAGGGLVSYSREQARAVRAAAG